MRRMSRLMLRLVLLASVALLNGRVRHVAADPQAGLWAKSLPHITLSTQDGKEVHFYNDLLKGKCAIINFMYTTCDGKLCTRGVTNLKKVQEGLEDLKKHLGYDVSLYSITLDPKHDTPEVLKEYAKTHGAKWTFLTGTPKDIEELRRALGQTISDSKKDADRTNHTGAIQIFYEPLGKKASISVLANPQRIWDMIERVCTQ
jgi:protein SCO1/2